MFEKILVSIDSSERSKKVIDEAANLTKATSAKLMLLHILSYDEENSPYMPTILGDYPVMNSTFIEQIKREQLAYENQGLEMLKSHIEKLAHQGINAEFSQNYGYPGRTICQVANNWGADLIIAGRRGHSGLNELLLGSTSNYILHHAPCSVLIIQGEK